MIGMLIVEGTVTSCLHLGVGKPTAGYLLHGRPGCFSGDGRDDSESGDGRLDYQLLTGFGVGIHLTEPTMHHVPVLL